MNKMFLIALVAVAYSVSPAFGSTPPTVEFEGVPAIDGVRYPGDQAWVVQNGTPVQKVNLTDGEWVFTRNRNPPPADEPFRFGPPVEAESDDGSTDLLNTAVPVSWASIASIAAALLGAYLGKNGVPALPKPKDPLDEFESIPDRVDTIKTMIARLQAILTVLRKN